MTNCTTKQVEFTACKRRHVQADFSGGDISSDGGVVLLREMDRRLGLSGAIASCLSDFRNKKQIRHDQQSMLRQRVYGICQGYEDLNDHLSLRTDPLIQTAVDKDTVLFQGGQMLPFKHYVSNFWLSQGIPSISEFLTPVGKTSREALISKEPDISFVSDFTTHQ